MKKNPLLVISCLFSSFFLVAEYVSARGFEGVSASVHTENVLSGIKDTSFKESYVLMRNFGAGFGLDYTQVLDRVAFGFGAKYSFTWHNRANFPSWRGMKKVAFEKKKALLRTAYLCF